MTFVGEDDVVSEQIPPPAESASKWKIQPNNDESSSNEPIQDDLAAAKGYRLVSMDRFLKFVERIHSQTPCNVGKNYVS